MLETYFELQVKLSMITIALEILTIWCRIVNPTRRYALFKSNSNCSDFNMYISYACQIYGPVGHSTLIIRVGIRFLWPQTILQKCSFFKLTFFVIEPFLLELYLMFQLSWKHNLLFWLSKTH